MLATAGLAAAGSAARADTLTFVNTCGTGAWNTLCSDGAGGFRSNWGRTGPNPALLYPGATDTAVVAGTVLLDANPTVAGVVVPAGTTLTWENTSLNAGLLDNSGTIQAFSGFNRFFTGQAVNQPTGQWTIGGGSLYLVDGVVENDGTMTLSGGGGVRRNGGLIASSRLQNAGLVHVTSAEGSTVSSVTVVGSPSGLWRTDAGALLTFEAVALQGMIVGDHHGDSVMTSAITLGADATLGTTAGSNPWGWTSASVDTTGHTLTNSGGLRLSSGFNKFLTGTAVNAPSASWAVDDGALYLSPSGGVTTLNNSGTLTVGAAAIRRNGGSIADTVLVNNGVVRATQPGALISGVTLSGGGQWATDAGAACTYEGVSLGGQFIGNHTGTGAFTGAVTLWSNATLGTQAGSTNPWDWNSAAIDTGPFTLTNAGRFRTVSGFNKFITGTMVNAPGATLELSAGNLYLTGAPTVMTNNGEVVFTGAGWLVRNGGPIENARLVNNGVLRSATAGAIVQGLSVTSNGGVWRTNAGATLEVSAVAMSGQLVGDHAGDATLTGSSSLSGDATLTTLASSANAWKWSSAVIDTGAFTLTNAGRLEMMSGFNKFLTGAAVNAAGATWTCVEGNFYLNIVDGAPVTFTNNGTLALTNSAGVWRNGGTPTDGVFTNNGLLAVTGGSSSIETLAAANGQSGVIRVSSGASLRFPPDWTLVAGRLEGSGTVAANGIVGVTNAATVAPHVGAATGTMHCSSRFVQSAEGTLEIAVVPDGVSQTADQLALTGSGFNAVATLGGTLKVVLPGGTSQPPIPGQDIVIVDAPGGRLGTFTSVVEGDPIPNYRYMVVYTPTQALLRVIRRCGSADFGSAGADANFDGQLDNNDFIVFIDKFFSMDAEADVGIAGGLVGSDGVFDNNDFIAFISLFFEGCH